MGIIGIGADIAHIPRILALVERRTAARLAARILSNQELSVWRTIPASDTTRQNRFLAVRWSIKEAAYKALYPLVRPTWKQLTFRSFDSISGRKPFMEYQGALPEGLQLRMHPTISHDGNYVFATVLVESV